MSAASPADTPRPALVPVVRSPAPVQRPAASPAASEVTRLDLTQQDESEQAAPTRLRPAAAPQKCAVIAFTGVPPAEAAHLKEQLPLLGATFSDSFNTSVTHLVTGAQGLTAKAVAADLAGVWRVNVLWLEQSLKAGKLLDPTQFDGLRKKPRTLGSGMNGRCLTHTSAASERFYLTETAYSKLGGPTQANLLFVQVGRGKLVSTFRAAVCWAYAAQVKSPAEATVKLRWDNDPDPGAGWQLVTAFLHSIVQEGPPPKRQHLEE
jgi:hypothetical protein